MSQRPSIASTSAFISNRGIINLSNYQPTSNELDLLALGKQCVLPPEPQSHRELEEQFMDFRDRLLWRIFLDDKDSDPTKIDILISKSKKTPLGPETQSTTINSYLDQIQRRIKREHIRVQHRPLAKIPARLKQAQRSLRNNHSIVVKPADKNLGVTIVNASWYKSEAERHLNDTTTYQSIPEDALQQRIRRTIITLEVIIQRLNIPAKTATYFRQHTLSTKFRVSRFYLIPKIHKTPVLGRPIVSSINWITTNASRWVDATLQPFCRRIPGLVQNSVDVIRYLAGRTFPLRMVFLSADVDSLYPSIDLADCLVLLHRFCVRNKIPEQHQLLAIIEWILKNNIIEFAGQYFVQIKGTAMGTPAAVVIANIYMFELERELLADPGIPRPLYYFRFIDDISGGFKTHNEMMIFFLGFNQLRPTIRLTMQAQYTHSDFLDITLYPSPVNNHIEVHTRLYTKPMNTHLYLPPCSFHTRSTINAFITGELKRYRILCFENRDFQVARSNFWTRLQARGYTSTFLLPLFNTPLDRQHLLLTHTTPLVPPTQPIRFKTCLDEHTEHMNWKYIFQVPEYLDTHPIARHIINPTKPPNICFKRSSNIIESVSTSKFTV